MISPILTATFGSLGPVCRLGLATRGSGNLDTADVWHALERGVNFLNWCGHLDALSRTVAELGPRRREVVVCVQFEARTADDAKRELEQILLELGTDYVDVLTFYYVEEVAEWRQIIGPGGALEACRAAREAGQVRLLGLTSHQRPLAAETARSGLLDMLMIRYNAAHRGAEKEVFPVTAALGMPVVTYTALRWGALLRPTPDDPPSFGVPHAPAWYRFVLQDPAATVVLMAPESRAELQEDLAVLEAASPLSEEEYQRLAAHGQRVRRSAGSFP
ncbi:MAG TPA: aldo/keto reductase [Gemmataceae bacterium]|nr:aldo/keto reductase [Gemmataceae bacterium]